MVLSTGVSHLYNRPADSLITNEAVVSPMKSSEKTLSGRRFYLQQIEIIGCYKGLCDQFFITLILHRISNSD